MNDQHDNVMKCEEIQDALFDYMARELGESRSELVREHLRRCAACSRAASEIQETLSLLETDSRQASDIPEALSDEHRKRVIRSIAHPILDWSYRHHGLVSTVVAMAAVTLAFFVLKHATSRSREPPESGPPVMIKHGDPDAGNPSPKGP